MDGSLVKIRFTLNGGACETQVEPGTTALRLLRDTLKLKGTKEGCGIGECGACTIVVDGRAVNACLMLLGQARKERSSLRNCIASTVTTQWMLFAFR